MSAAWKVDDFNSDLARLSSLMSVICDLQFGLAIEEKDLRVDDLLWIAREVTDGLKERHEATFTRKAKGGAA